MYSKVANFILSNKHNTSLPGEKHQVIYLSDGTYNPAVFSGPGTNLEVRLKRGDQPLSAVDKEAEAHDIRYLLAKNEDDVKKADETMINKLNDVRARKLDSNFNINQAELIRLKYYANKLGVSTSFFTTFGADSQAQKDLVPLAEKKLQELEQQGYGKSRPRRLYKDEKGTYYKSFNNHDESYKSYIKGDNKSGRDLYIINLTNQKPIPRKASSKKEVGTGKGDDKKLNKMIPSGGVSGSSSNTGVPSTKQEIVNAYNEGMNRNPLLDQYRVLLDQYKDDEKELAIAEEKDKPDIKKRMDLTTENLAILQQQLTDEEKQQAEYENMSNYSEDISRPDNLNRMLHPAPAEYRGESIGGIGTNNASSVSEGGAISGSSGASISSFNPSSDMGSSFNPGTSSSGSNSSGSSSSDSSGSDMGSVKVSDITQPIIEPVVATESLMPMDNTPDLDSVSKIEEELNTKLTESKDEPVNLLENKPDVDGNNSGYKNIMDELNRLEVIQKDAEKLYYEKRKIPRYSTLDDMDKKQNSEGLQMSFEDLSSARKNLTQSEPKTEPKTEPKSSSSKFINFSQITTPARRIKILLGEADLSPYNKQFLSDSLRKIPPGGRVTKKIISKTDMETIDLLWSGYSDSIRKTDQRSIINKYLDQTGFGKMDEINENGLTTSHVEQMMKKYTHINLAVIASDEILTLKKGLNKNTDLVPFIMNLDPSDKPGSHWVGVVIDNKSKYVGYFDSLCIHPTTQILNDLKELVKVIDPVHMFKFKFNTVRDQGMNSGKCGLYAMAFLHNILNGMSFKKSSGFYDKDYKNKEHKIMDTFGFL